ncbi:dTMP kinase [Pseudonocardia spinosispora]|uniref:dTMP kinase n=1 Tax=Pseudonocardia spinosispora TaxID=103441 RepID=UPI00048D24D6|nr:dTMP kinase [Pseudonocardia spinosispora]
MGRLVVIEGLDGAGKRTLTDGLCAELSARGVSVSRLAFPRYDTDVYGPLVSDALHGRLGDLTDSVYGMAVLFALDRRAAAAEIRAALATVDVVLVDRYIASNAAYGAARLHQPVDGDFVGWVRALELDRFDLPRPDLQLLLRVPRSLAAARAAQRESQDAARTRDAYESDDKLQDRCALLYDALAESAWLSPWHVLDGSASTSFTQLADVIAGSGI